MRLARVRTAPLNCALIANITVFLESMMRFGLRPFPWAKSSVEQMTVISITKENFFFLNRTHSQTKQQTSQRSLPRGRAALHGSCVLNVMLHRLTQKKDAASALHLEDHHSRVLCRSKCIVTGMNQSGILPPPLSTIKGNHVQESSESSSLPNLQFTLAQSR